MSRPKDSSVVWQYEQKIPGVYVVQSMFTEAIYELPRSFKFTDAKIRDVPFERAVGRQRIHWDEETRGFGLVVGLEAKSFIVQKDIKGKSRRVTIGKFDPWFAEAARQEARRLLVSMDQGQDPRDKKRADEWNASVQAITLRHALDSHLARDLKTGTRVSYKRTMDCIFEDWMDKPIVEITRDMVLAKYNVTRARASAHADLGMRILQAVIKSASRINRRPDGSPLIAENPVQIITDSRMWAKSKPRVRVLSDDELPKWFKAIEAVRADETEPSARVGCDYLELVLFTGLRRNEAARLEWTKVDLDAKTIKIEDTKNKKPHTLPLTDYIVSILRRRKTESDGKWVFPSAGRCPGQGHFAEPRHVVEAVQNRGKIAKFCVHDLRRTFATTGLLLKLNPYLVKRLLNHTVSGDVTFLHYFVTNVDDMREPMQAITDRLCMFKAKALGLQLAVA